MTEESDKSLVGDQMARTTGFAGLASTMVATLALADCTDAVVVCDVTQLVVAWNLAAERVFGLSAEEAVGRSATEFLELANQPPEAITASLRDGESRKVVLAHRGGTAFSAQCSRTGVFATSGDRIGFLIVVRPLGRGRESETSQIQQSVPVARRVAEVYHDMRQPLTTIEYLLQGALTNPEDSPTRETLIGIRQQVKYLADLAGDLLNEDRDVRKSVDVGALLQAVAATVQSQAVKNSVEVKVVTPEQLVISASEVEVRRAVTNLVENAIRAAGAAGQVWVSAACRRGMVEFCVEDSGPGYEGEPRSELSLGLSITEQVARAHGGRVEAGVSDWLGGAAFRLLLPSPNR